MSANLFPAKKMTPQQVGLLSAAIPSPFGDALGLLADGVGYAQDPKSLTLGRGLLSLAALAPGVPSRGAVKAVNWALDSLPRGARLEMLPPAEYLRMVEAAQGKKFTDLPRPVYRPENVKKLKRALDSGKRMEVPWLKIEGGRVVDQEGRHRAMAAIESGLNEMPVYVFEKP